MSKKILYNVTNNDEGASGGTAYGTAFKIAGGIDPSTFALQLYANNDSGTSPTLDITIQISFDGTNFVASGVAFTQVTTESANYEIIQWGDNPIAPYIRVKAVYGGTDTPTYDAIVTIIDLCNDSKWGDE